MVAVAKNIQNEYTDWERPPRNQLGSRDAALELLSDGHTVAPLIRLGYLHSLRGGKSYFMHYKHRTGERDFPQVRKKFLLLLEIFFLEKRKKWKLKLLKWHERLHSLAAPLNERKNKYKTVNIRWFKMAYK